MYAQVAQNEKGAALVGSVKEKFGGVFKFLFFTCATIVTFSGVLSIVVAATNFRPAFDFVNYVFLTLFGLIMLVVDAPYDSPGLRSFRMAVFWYGLFMTRFVGRGVWYLFLASITVGALYDNDILPMLGCILGGYVAGVAAYSIFFGWKLSSNLEAVRKKIVEQGPDQWGAYIPPNGMSKIQFRDLAASLQAITFTEEELHYIVAAMSVDVRSDGLISREEFEDWVRGPDMLVL
mmetsp:Transcript_10509/g.25672  ORF Transcript_10509/g.25672 Transcript_10509/m.25672 type:complete len:234 (+) Transcript_10509:93-794(+)|eukprot:CAMPEP_0178993996 /NCGR_PEP_ID=MMETSP0795-20121207/7029_1 /TAXON_ID=88552 /ORGANISM="Amoebophrya sp., Strain Ameob2" /LENGTH=233 /DNA_ID=CAMNT_0020686149 /DNA_START=66 /DNA_END=767 /DNA_ORIENTATION=+